MKRLKRCAFGLAAFVMATLTAATVIEKMRGTSFVAEHLYGAPWFVALWAALTLCAAAYVLRRRLWRRPSACLLHLAFVVILCGAFVTRIWGRQGTLHLRTDGDPVSAFTDRDGVERSMPFGVRLDDFSIVCYPGTQAPMDFVSRLTLDDGHRTLRGEVAMNRILRFRGYRLYQSTYDSDGGGSTLAVSCDPWGIGITYAGYAMLLLAMIALFADPRSGFRRLLRSSALRRTGLVALFTAGCIGAQGAEPVPPTVPRDVADELGRLGVYYNDRICPLSTLARDFTTKLCGSDSYRGLTAEQTLAGWLFYYDAWKSEPMIRIKSAEVRRRMGIGGRMACLADFRHLLAGGEPALSRGESEAEEKFRLVSMVCTGSMLRLFPYVDPADGGVHWASQIDTPPRDLPHDQQLFLRRTMNYINELVARRDWETLRGVIRKIAVYQRREAGETMPSAARFRAERLYGRIGRPLPVAVTLFAIGIVAFVYAVRRMTQRRPFGRRVRLALRAGLVVGTLWLTAMLVLRGWIAGHWPMSNGFETMQCMAWCALMLTLLFGRRFPLAMPFGYLVGGMAMMVSMMGASNPQITPLMPVLSSPLLSIHVMLVMISYALFAAAMCNGVAGVVLCRTRRRDAERLRDIGLLMLYPAVCCLAAGIFTGAVWANVSWGRYWGWDPKEVWALITMMLYAFALHGESLPRFRRPLFFHLFCIVAFLAVIVTYFGVNFLLGGLHSYAA